MLKTLPTTGQFWNRPAGLRKFNGTLEPGVTFEDLYTVTLMNTKDSDLRFVTGTLFPLSWEKKPGPCFFAGGRQAGPIRGVVDFNDGVIEGNYKQYEVPGLLDEGQSYIYARFQG